MSTATSGQSVRAVRLAVVAGLVALVVGLMACGDSEAGRERATFDYVVPAGAGDRIDAGEPLEILPGALVADLDETIQIVNEDDRAHLVGPSFVGAGETLRQRFNVARHGAALLPPATSPGRALRHDRLPAPRCAGRVDDHGLARGRPRRPDRGSVDGRCAAAGRIVRRSTLDDARTGAPGPRTRARDRQLVPLLRRANQTADGSVAAEDIAEFR